MDNIRFAGMGISQVFMLFVLFVLLIVATKTVLNKYPVTGLTEIINAV